MSDAKQFHLREGTLVEGKSLGCLNVYLAYDYDQLKAENERLGEAWRKRKHELACIFAEQQTDPRVANALRTRYMEANKP